MLAGSSNTFADRFLPRDPRTRAAVWMALLFYSCTLVIFTVTGFMRGPESFRESLTIGIPMMVVDGFLSFQIFWVLKGVSRFPPVAQWSLVAIAVVVIALIQAGWDTQLRTWIGTVLSDFRTPYQAYVRAATINVYNTGMFAALLAFQGAYLNLKKHQRLLEASRQSERDAHMLALRFQLNPHFLFNTLNAISSLVVVGRAADAEAMIDRLSSFLRASLTADPHSLVSLDEEFEIIDSYLDIESIRFGDRLVATVDLPSGLGAALIPPFLLQPLVENAIKYAVAPSTHPVEVRILAEERGGALVLTVADDGEGHGAVAPGTGVGLANVRERLALNYGPRAWLERHQDAPGYRVEIVMPLVKGSEGASVAGPASPAFA